MHHQDEGFCVVINVVNEEELLMHDYSTVINCPTSTKNGRIDRVSCGSIIQREFINSNTSEEKKTTTTKWWKDD